jgi:hypothetical protein
MYHRQFRNFSQNTKESSLLFKRFIRILESKMTFFFTGIRGTIPLIPPPALKNHAVFVKYMGKFSGYPHYRPAEPFFLPLLKPRDKGNVEAIAGSLRFGRKSKSNPPRRNLRGYINRQPVAGGYLNSLFYSHVSNIAQTGRKVKGGIRNVEGSGYK